MRFSYSSSRKLIQRLNPNYIKHGETVRCGGARQVEATEDQESRSTDGDPRKAETVSNKNKQKKTKQIMETTTEKSLERREGKTRVREMKQCLPDLSKWLTSEF